MRISTAPRILCDARDRLLPRTLAAVNQGGTPAWALLSCLGVGVVLILSGTIESLISIASVIAVTTYLSGFGALLVLRKREPLLARPYKTWWYPWSTIGALVASVGFLLGAVTGDLRQCLHDHSCRAQLPVFRNHRRPPRHPDFAGQSRRRRTRLCPRLTAICPGPEIRPPRT